MEYAKHFYKVRFWYKTNDPYNKRYQSELGNAKDVITKSVIVHFAARPKPWEWYCTHPLRKEFLAELKSNGFRLKQREWSNWPGFWGHLKATLMGFGRYNGRCYPKSSVWHWVIPILNFLTERKNQNDLGLNLHGHEKLKIAWITGDYFIDVDFLLVPYLKEHYKNEIDISWTVIKSHNSNIQIDSRLGCQIIKLKHRNKDPRVIEEYYRIIKQVEDSANILYSDFVGAPFIIQYC